MANEFTYDVKPLVQKYCYGCHGSKKVKGDLNLETTVDLAHAMRFPDVWDEVAEQVRERNMPPDDEPQPSLQEMKILLDWINGLIERVENPVDGAFPGHVTVRRLNKTEYNNTVRDLFGIQFRPARGFPGDGAGEAGFDNNADALFLSPLLLENYVRSARAIVRTIFTNEGYRRRFYDPIPRSGLFDREAERLIEHYGKVMYRRPLEMHERRRLVDLYKSQRKAKRSLDRSMATVIEMLLLSPKFLYRGEAQQHEEEVFRITPHEMASRLSYFLWASMPDEALFTVADAGTIFDPEVLGAQVNRMLADPKSKALARHFAGQWFGWDELRSSIQPDRKKYPEFTPSLRYAMYLESVMFFHDLLENDGNLVSLLHADYTFLNEELATHYQLDDVEGKEFRRVSLNDKNRGGVLGMGSVLTGTSLPLRTSPVLRGVFVLEKILDDPTPPPPMNVAQLPEDDREAVGKTFREVMESHLIREDCRTCHLRIDPIGFGLENFDALGRWRTTQGGQALDVSGKLPGGDVFAGPVGLKRILIKRRADFARTATRKMLAYALGRDLKSYDRPAVKSVSSAVMDDGYKLRTLVMEVVKSYPFQYRAPQTIE